MDKNPEKDEKIILPSPVPTQKDERAKEHISHGFRDRRGEADAPDGISGNWS